MSGLVGKGTRSYKKAIVSDSNFPALGFRNFLMAFQAPAAGVAANTSVPLIDNSNPLVVPQEMVDNGFQQPDNIEITNARLGTFRNNVEVTSNLNGVLIDRIAYLITNDSITFDVGLNPLEIITIKRGSEAVTGNRIVDARPLRASGLLDYSQATGAIFQVGEGFRIAPSTLVSGAEDNRQIGFVQVFVDGVLQARNSGNLEQSGTTQTGNYREVIVDGLGNLITQNGVTANAIQLNPGQSFAMMDPIIVISTNLIVDSPNNTGVLDQVDALGERVTVTETATGVNTTNIATNTSGIATNTAAIAGLGGGAVLQIDTFEDITTNTTYVYTIPDTATSLEVEAAGGGSNGNSGTFEAGTIRGGAGGQYDTRYLPLAAGTGRTLTVTIGGIGGNTILANDTGSALMMTETWSGAYYGSTANTVRGSAGHSRGRGGSNNNFATMIFGGGGGGWVAGNDATAAAVGTGGHGGMIIKALGLTLNVRT